MYLRQCPWVGIQQRGGFGKKLELRKCRISKGTAPRRGDRDNVIRDQRIFAGVQGSGHRRFTHPLVGDERNRMPIDRDCTGMEDQEFSLVKQQSQRRAEKKQSNQPRVGIGRGINDLPTLPDKESTVPGVIQECGVGCCPDGSIRDRNQGRRSTDPIVNRTSAMPPGSPLPDATMGADTPRPNSGKGMSDRMVSP